MTENPQEKRASGGAEPRPRKGSGLLFGLPAEREGDLPGLRGLPEEGSRPGGQFLPGDLQGLGEGVHRRLPDSVSHSTAYRRRIAFCDSLMEISLWFERHYGTGRNRFRILRRRSSVALWVLSWEGSVGEYLARWWSDVRRCPRLLLCPEGPGLLVKKILFRRHKTRKP